ncbi:alanine racemase [Sphingorhabdus sp.]|jgi:alanine racemase|uniref:alanine racemase n=2 Tax=Sphingorhabdus sp. TaxID=1902408 RepID=UPI003BB05ABE|nr:alanine racemase [Sphingomonadales bacterium]
MIENSEAFAAPLRLRLDGEALVANWRTLSKLSGSGATGAAVKADGYGVGASEVSRRLWEAGCRDFFVAHWSEAVALSKVIPAQNIAVLNGIQLQDIPAIRALDAVPVLNTPLQIEHWKTSGGGRCHVMLDSGINRLGIGPGQISSDLFNGLDIDMLCSHLASADEDVPQNDAQLRLFTDMSTGIACRRRSFANSAGIVLGKDFHFDLTRPGLSLYGGIARAELAGNIRQVVFPSARVLQIREHEAGAPIGYNATYRTTGSKRIATLAIGYADGYFRAFSAIGYVEIGGEKHPVLGRVSMDLVTVDITHVQDVAEGDWIDIGFELHEASYATGTSQYELLTGIGSRADRVWS